MKSRHILYCGVHPPLEYDDLSLLTGLGHTVFSTGVYRRPDSTNRWRPSKPQFFSPDDYCAFAAGGGFMRNRKPYLTHGFCQRFDLIIVMDDPNMLIANQDAFAGRPVIFRSIGQSSKRPERTLRPYKRSVTLVRCSPCENAIEHSVEGGRVIRFAKEPKDYGPWQGGGGLLTFFNGIGRRHDPVSTADACTRFGVDLYGHDNDGVPGWRGPASDQRALYAQCRAYFYVHSGHAPYTLNLIEAMMTGAPIVAPSAVFLEQHWGRLDRSWRRDRYEVPELLRDCGLMYDSIEEAEGIIAQLGSLPLSEISARTRARAERLFATDGIAAQWQDAIDAACTGPAFARPTLWARVSAKLRGRRLRPWRSDHRPPQATSQ